VNYGAILSRLKRSRYTTRCSQMAFVVKKLHAYIYLYICIYTSVIWFWVLKGDKHLGLYLNYIYKEHKFNTLPKHLMKCQNWKPQWPISITFNPSRSVHYIIVSFLSNFIFTLEMILEKRNPTQKIMYIKSSFKIIF